MVLPHIPPAGEPEPVMQFRCVRCKSEHHVLAVYAISLGAAGCASCGHIPPVFYVEELYRKALYEEY